MVNYNPENAGNSAFFKNKERRIAMKQLKDRKTKFYNWIGYAVLCFMRGVEAVSGKILFV